MRCTTAAAVILVAAPVLAAPEPVPDPLACLPDEANQVLTARVEGTTGGQSVRLYFRRLNPTGAFYSVEMEPSADGSWWTVFPKPENRRQEGLSDEWWEILQDRDWVAGRDRDDIEDWLDGLEHEAAEYFVAVHDPGGERVGRSPDHVVEVLDAGDCDHPLNILQSGLARNLTVGETTEAQLGKPVFHWLCDGVVTRLGSTGILRGDDYCRSCVVAAWFPLAVAAAAPTAGITITFREPEEATQDQP